MEVVRTERGFQILLHPTCLSGEKSRIAQQSSAIGDYCDAIERPGTSALWIGNDHHLNREEVRSLIDHLQRWLETGSLEDRP